MNISHEKDGVTHNTIWCYPYTHMVLPITPYGVTHNTQGVTHNTTRSPLLTIFILFFLGYLFIYLEKERGWI